MKRINLVYIVTIPMSAKSFLSGQLAYMRKLGYQVSIISSEDRNQTLKNLAKDQNIDSHVIPFLREISLQADLISLSLSIYKMLKIKPIITNVGTPKAGLIGGLAAVVTGVPVRVYTLHGLRLETVNGPKQHLLLWMERLACACAHRVVCVSPSLRQRAIQLGIVAADKAIVLGNGTCNGLNHQRFFSVAQEDVQHLRATLSLPLGTPTIGFVGRFVRDKGIAELVEAFKQLYDTDPRIRLLLLGDYEEGDPVAVKVRQTIEIHPGIIRAGFVKDTAPYYQLIDVLALPTYREGYPTTPLEAAAAGKPVVASNATGAIDAVVDGVTGLTVPIGDTNALATALGQVLADRELAQRLGQAGQERVLNDFQPQAIWQALDDLYKKLLAEAQVRQAQKPRRTSIAILVAAGMVALTASVLTLGRTRQKQKP